MNRVGASISRETLLSGWGANVQSSCRLIEPDTIAGIPTFPELRNVIARGLGRSYGDAATNDGGHVLRLTAVNKVLAFDEHTGTLTAEAGISLESIIDQFAPLGWFPMITPGTKFVTLGILSFPKEGYTFAIDFPIRSNTVTLLRRLDAMVLDCGGRIYLGKDSYVRPEMFRAMYPQIEDWLAIKAKYDPACVFASDLGRRVGLA